MTNLLIASEAVTNKSSFMKLMKRVISDFQPLAERDGREQFAVLLMMGKKDGDWNDFKYRTAKPTKVGDKPDIGDTNRKLVSPSIITPEHLSNYIATLPKGGKHAEQRILDTGLRKQHLLQSYVMTHGQLPNP